MTRWKREDWLDGHYELLMVFEDQFAPIDAAQSLWSLPQVSGVWREPEFDLQSDCREDAQNILVACSLMEGNLYGIAHLPNGKSAPCGSAMGKSSGWLALFLPLAGLALSYDIGRFPFGDADRPWIREVNDWLAGIGSEVFRTAPFMIAAIGFETETVEILSSTKTKPAAALNCELLFPSGEGVRRRS